MVSGKTQPSTFAVDRTRSGATPCTASALAARMASSDGVTPSPSRASTKRSPAASISAPGAAPPRGPKPPPLSPMAAWKRPRASGVAISWLTLHEPADSPKMVTRDGSPPNAAMLRCTQPRAATWSRRP